MLRPSRIALGTAALCLALTAVAQKPVIYPAKGQTAEQQNKDDGECYTWAKGNTGIDPAAVAAAPPPAQPAQGPAVGGGQRAGGAVKGAVVGGIIDGDDGAKKGAAVGVVAGGSKARQQQRAQADASQQQAQQGQQQQMATFYKAYGACMEGKGYTVK